MKNCINCRGNRKLSTTVINNNDLVTLLPNQIFQKANNGLYKVNW